MRGARQVLGWGALITNVLPTVSNPTSSKAEAHFALHPRRTESSLQYKANNLCSVSP